ncbi:hypothetical protein IIE26_05215 [Cytobacillus oceanisediminis]|uniref:hypothetical protein n=1 Tax=Cytobacillus oceanisediminis TaxID=665099 RepID=UPI0018641D1A|nr:hypothetical protein [Cytobacillus oceanisediminis]QOK28069.1 hypothetical protein IIE26_05215 [Cytobacillus oceanisediminis]
MAIKSGFFNSVGGDRIYKADFFAEYFASFIANGVFPNPSTGLQVMANTGMTVNIKAGKAWIKGYYFANDADYTLQLDVADGVLKRIDRIGLRLDFSSREISPVIIKGVFASSPVAPALQRDADAYEIALADVYINNGTISISQVNITDQRLNTSLCGIVHGTVSQVDTTTIFNQYQAWFNDITSSVEGEIDAWQAVQQQEFDTWFQSIQDILDGDVAANLANRITQLENDFATHNSDSIRHITAEERTVWSNQLKIYKSGKDANGVFTVVEYKRQDDTLYAKSSLSGGTGPQYTTRTVTYYAADGMTVVNTVTWTLTYDSDGDLISEVKG